MEIEPSELANDGCRAGGNGRGVGRRHAGRAGEEQSGGEREKRALNEPTIEVHRLEGEA